MFVVISVRLIAALFNTEKKKLVSTHFVLGMTVLTGNKEQVIEEREFSTV